MGATLFLFYRQFVSLTDVWTFVWNMNVRAVSESLWMSGIMNEYWYKCVLLEAACHSLYLFFSVLIKKMYVLYFLFLSICLCTTLHDVAIF